MIVFAALIALIVLMVWLVCRVEANATSLQELRTQITADRSEAATRIQDHVSSLRQLSGKVTELADAIKVLSRKPVGVSPLDGNFFARKSQDEMIALAESLATLRPLVPYPGWRFDAEWSNPDLAFQLRQQVWQEFNDRKSEAAATIGWHDGTRLHVYLGNDLSRQIYIAGCIDPNEFAFLDRYLRLGMTFFDAGANEGAYTVFAAKRVGSQGTVWAFEPSARELARLKRNLDLNGLSARIFPVALADSSGQAEFTIAGYEHEGQNTLGSIVYEGVKVAAKQFTQLARLDDLVDANPPARIDLIKVDVEGAELRLFQGASATLHRYKPVLLFEVSEASLQFQGSRPKDLVDYLRAQNYVVYVFGRHTGLLESPANGAFGDNMVAVPAGISLPASVFKIWE